MEKRRYYDLRFNAAYHYLRMLPVEYVVWSENGIRIDSEVLRAMIKKIETVVPPYRVQKLIEMGIENAIADAQQSVGEIYRLVGELTTFIENNDFQKQIATGKAQTMAENKAKAMTPEELRIILEHIEKDEESDPEKCHLQMDQALCEALERLGYGSAIEIFKRTNRHYS